MKKTFVILTIVLAILAAPVFAEVTASGEVDFEWAFNADDYAETIDSNDMTINLGGTVGEYTSIKAEFEGEFADTDGTIGDGMDGTDATDDAVYLNQATLTQDITGVLGIQSPVSVALTVGVDSVGDDPVNYNEVAGYNFASDGQLDPGTIMTKVSLGIDTITVDLSVWEHYNFAAEVYGNVAEIADVSAYVYTGDDVSTMDDIGTADLFVFGFNGAATVMEGLDVGAGLEYTGFDDAAATGTGWADVISYYMEYGISVAYTMDALSAGVSFATFYVDANDYSMAENTEAALNVSYAVTDMLTPFAAVGSVLDPGDDDFSDVVYYEIGVQAALDGVTYTTGYTLGSDWNAYDAEMTDGDDRAGNFFVKVGAEF